MALLVWRCTKALQPFPGFHTGFFVGGKFSARLRTLFKAIIIIPFSWCIVLFQHYLDKPHHFILTYRSGSKSNLQEKSPNITKPYKIVHRLSKFWGGGNFRWGGKIPGAPPPLCMKPCFPCHVVFKVRMMYLNMHH